MKTKLSVNVNKIALLRNSRGRDFPNVIKLATDIVKFGSDGITVHPRPDGRHIRHQDVMDLKKILSCELNVEGYPDERFLRLIEECRPAQCTLVPDPPEALTSNAGWKVEPSSEILKNSIRRIKKMGTRVSVFIDPLTVTPIDLESLKKWDCDRVELYTERYATDYDSSLRDKTLGEYVRTAKLAQESGLEINAGHDLNLDNLFHLISAIPFIKEVSIGHALIVEALYLGLETTIGEYQKRLEVNSHA